MDATEEFMDSFENDDDCVININTGLRRQLTSKVIEGIYFGGVHPLSKNLCQCVVKLFCLK